MTKKIEPIIHEGEIVTCENGHRLYRILRDIRRYEIIHPDQFERLDKAAQEPKVNEEIEQCPHCSGHWYRWEPRLSVHTDRGWTE